MNLSPRLNRPSSFGRLGRNVFLYGFGTIAGRIVSVIMLPVYTRYLSPSQYGILQLLDIAVDVTALLFTAGIRSGLQRFYFKAKTAEERKQIVFTTFFLEMALTIAGALVLVASWNVVNGDLRVGLATSNLIRLAALNFTLTAMTAVPLAFLMIEQRAALSTIVGLFKLAIQVALNVYFLVYRHLGVASLLLSTAIATSIVGSLLVGWMIRRTGIRVSWAVIRDLRRFGLPYQLTTVAAFILTFGDRFFLEHFNGAAEVGLYGLAYQFGFLLWSVGGAPFLTAWNPERHELASQSREERDASYDRGFFYFNLLVVTTALGIVVFARPAIAALTSTPYHGAAAIVPIIVAAYVVQCWSDAVRFGIDVSERTKLYAWASWISTAVVLMAYAALIPRYGGYGAAWATLIAFVVRFALTLRWSQQVWPVTYRWRRLILLTTIATAIGAPAVLLPTFNVSRQFALGAGLIALYFTLTWRFILDDEHRFGILAVIRTRRLSAVFGRA